MQCLMNSDNLGDTCSYQYEEQYNLRPHRLASGYNVSLKISFISKFVARYDKVCSITALRLLGIG